MAVVTDLALLGFDEATGRLRLDALQAGVSENEVAEATGFELLRAGEVDELPPPSPEELAELRALRGEAANGNATPKG